MEGKENKQKEKTTPTSTSSGFIEMLPVDLSESLRKVPVNILEDLEEIRLRVGFPVSLCSRGREYQLPGAAMEFIDANRLREYFSILVGYSVYSYQEDIAKGFITLQGGHRVGLCGVAVVERGRVRAIKDISSMSIRRGREFIGISNTIMKYLMGNGFYNTLILSPPKCGKTTLLRDIVRNVSNAGFRVGVCDERSEIGGCYRGVPTYDLGQRTDVLDGCPKEEGLLMLIRSMSPDIVATDEIGRVQDQESIEKALVSGVGILTTIHGSSYEDVLRGPAGEMVKKGYFQRLITLSKYPHTGTILSIADHKNTPFYRMVK